MTRRVATPQDDAIRLQAYKIVEADRLRWQWWIAVKGAWRERTKARSGAAFADAYDETLARIDGMREICKQEAPQ